MLLLAKLMLMTDLFIIIGKLFATIKKAHEHS